MARVYRMSPPPVKPYEYYEGATDEVKPVVVPARKERFSWGAAIGITLFSLYIVGIGFVPSSDLKIIRDAVIELIRSVF